MQLRGQGTMSSKSRFSSESLTFVEATLLNSPPSSGQDVCCSCNCKGETRSRVFMLVPWAISLTLGICLIASQILHAVFHETATTTIIQNWRESDFVAAKADISAGLHTVRFDATIKFNDSHLAYRPPTEPAYVGQPSAEIDNNWENLLGAVNIFVTPSEQKLLGTELWLDPATGLYMAE
ncbi:hypothetical protein CI102_12571 [Trichoderma harzianum]|nr:hypothetical protein CI102_12571 [Trichoderma harzianum]